MNHRPSTLFFLLFAALSLPAQPDFSKSEVLASRPTLVPLETMDYRVIVRNSGTSAPNWVEVENPIPPAMLLASFAPEWKFDRDTRELQWHGPIPPGEGIELRFSLIARPGTEGNTIADRAAIRFGGSEHNVFHEAYVDTPPKRGADVAGRVVIGFGALFAGAYLLARRARKPGLLPSVITTFVALAFLILFASMSVEDLRMARHYRETQCTVVDVLRQQRPIVAVRYAGQLSIIRHVPSHLGIGTPPPVSAGSVIPCWFDPSDPKRVVLDISLGGAYLFAILPLLLFAAGIGGIVYTSRRRVE